MKPETKSVDWRSIKCADVHWHCVPGVPRRIAWALMRQCTPGSSTDPSSVEKWDKLTLGELADMGERAWRQSASYGIGPTTIEAIKLTIDHAAAGLNITMPADAYRPRPIKSLQSNQS